MPAKRSQTARSKASELVLVLHGPNLNLLGKREPGVYGATTLRQIDAQLRRLASELNVDIETFQSNSEGEIIDRIHAAAGRVGAIVINPGAYTHTSVAIRDALLAVRLPVIEAHLSNTHKRESFRRRSLITDIAVGQVMGFGAQSYLLALRAAVDLLAPRRG
ncbi:MAG: type II 3-dehydroquinate dehydratase [Deltaproteobacteria bacterium]|nr:type II 3-dehydroquinate dehydratase [Deltaproteobacteria bacterium]